MGKREDIDRHPGEHGYDLGVLPIDPDNNTRGGVLGLAPEIPEPKVPVAPRVQIYGDRVLVRPRILPNVSPAGLDISAMKTNDTRPIDGYVVAVGPLVDVLGPAVGSHVFYSKYGGHEYPHGPLQGHLILSPNEIFGEFIPEDDGPKAA